MSNSQLTNARLLQLGGCDIFWRQSVFQWLSELDSSSTEELVVAEVHTVLSIWPFYPYTPMTSHIVNEVRSSRHAWNFRIFFGLVCSTTLILFVNGPERWSGSGDSSIHSRFSFPMELIVLPGQRPLGLRSLTSRKIYFMLSSSVLSKQPPEPIGRTLDWPLTVRLKVILDWFVRAEHIWVFKFALWNPQSGRILRDSRCFVLVVLVVWRP